ncbi:MAG: RpiB/LacA/LacB family sugar-phosphate isomerase, partial [Ilumatobacteraceae bacterium]
MAVIAIGSDHAGFELKSHLVARLGAAGHRVIDHGTDSTESVDYPSFCAAAARSVVTGEAEFGIVLGGSGQGEQLAANKVRGARAALCNCLYTARMAREHNDANVISLGQRMMNEVTALAIVDTWLNAQFEG